MTLPMKGYVEKALIEILHAKPMKLVHAPSKFTISEYIKESIVCICRRIKTNR